MLTNIQKSKALNQQYRLVGRHSAVKICFWTKECLRKGRVCYKQDFYDIHTANCLEMSPAITCNQRCLHCWRDTSVFSSKWVGKADNPKDIIAGCIKERQNLLVGFPGNKNLDLTKFQKALIPDHAAISLTGEPCLYPKLPQLIDSFFADFNFRSVFLVTNGTVPARLKQIGKKSKYFPTNIYLSLEAYDLKSHKQLNNPVVKDTWIKVQQSMKYLSKIKNHTRTILRITVIKPFNLDKAAKFLPFIQLMRPAYIEVKGYGYLGYSCYRLTRDNVPSWDEVQEFAQKLSEVSGYRISGKHQLSDIVQLAE